MILIGRNDADALATGWHPLQEGPAGVPCRWMSPRAVVRMPSGFRVRGTCMTVSAPGEIRGMRPGMSVYYGGTLLGHCGDLGLEGAWNTVQITFDDTAMEGLPTSAAAPLKLTLAVENREAGDAVPLAFVPHEVLGNGDLRELGALISSVRWMSG